MLEDPPVPDSDQLLKIGEFARQAGVSLRTLRYYEELGLIAPTARTRGGFRYYRQADLSRLRLIREMQDLGLTLDHIGDLLVAPDPSSDRQGFLERVRLALEEQERLITAHIAQFEEQRGRIGKGLAKLADCAACEHVPDTKNNHCEPCCLTGRHLPEALRALY